MKEPGQLAWETAQFFSKDAPTWSAVKELERIKWAAVERAIYEDAARAAAECIKTEDWISETDANELAVAVSAAIRALTQPSRPKEDADNG